MKTATTIIKNKVLPQLGKDAQFDSEKLNDAFWEKFATDFLKYETDPKPLYAAIYSLELEDAENVISKLPEFYNSVLEELAETYVLGESSEATENLLNSQNESFEQQVDFFKTLQQVIKSAERKDLKKNLPIMHDRLTFELSEAEIENAAKKKGREDLKAKMKVWDAELVEELEPVFMESRLEEEKSFSLNKEPQLNKKAPTKVISLNWIKYAVAASILITAGVFYFNNNSFSSKNEIVKENTVFEFNNENLASIQTDTVKSPVLRKSSFGFTADNEEVTIIFNNLQPRISSISKAILNYQKQLDTLLIAHKKDSISITNEFNKKVLLLNEEFDNLKEKENKYVFDGKVLTLFKTDSVENQLLLYKSHYYLKKGDQFFRLFNSDEPQQFKIETDSNVLEALERIVFDNGQQNTTNQIETDSIVFDNGQQNTTNQIETVFDKLVLAYGSVKTAPQLIVLNENSDLGRPAYYESYPKPTINIDQHLFDICRTFGKDSLNALSIVLSHELAHFYSDHTFCSDYAFAIRNSNKSLVPALKNTSLDEKIGKETEADQKGLFYAAAAGYNPFNLQETLLDKIYTYYDLPNALPGYPTLQQRKGIAYSAQEKAEVLYTEFNEGLNALDAKNYDLAIAAFENVNSYIPFRENYNNIGVAKTRKALLLKVKTLEEYKYPNRFLYPLEIENESRLAQEVTRSLDDDSYEQLFTLLKSSQKDFQEAIRLDPNFTKAFINLACVYDLLDNPMAAIGKIKELPIEQQKTRDAQRILAIAYYHADMEEKAEVIWEELEM